MEKNKKYLYFGVGALAILALGFNVWWACEEWDFGDDDDDHHHHSERISTNISQTINFDMDIRVKTDHEVPVSSPPAKEEDFQVFVESGTVAPISGLPSTAVIEEEVVDFAPILPEVTEKVSEQQGPIFYPGDIKVLNDQERAEVERVLNPIPQTFDEFVHRPKVLDDSIDQMSLFPSKDLFDNSSQSAEPVNQDYDDDYGVVANDPWELLKLLGDTYKESEIPDESGVTSSVDQLMEQVDYEMEEIGNLRNKSHALLEKIGQLIADQTDDMAGGDSVNLPESDDSEVLAEDVEEEEEVFEANDESGFDMPNDPNYQQLPSYSLPNFPYLPFFNPSNVPEVSQNEDGSLKAMPSNYDQKPSFPKTAENKRMLLLMPPKVIGPASNMGTVYTMGQEDQIDLNNPFSLGSMMRMMEASRQSNNGPDLGMRQLPDFQSKQTLGIYNGLRPVAKFGDEPFVPSRGNPLFEGNSGPRPIPPYMTYTKRNPAPKFNPFGSDSDDGSLEESRGSGKEIRSSAPQPDPHHVEKRVLENHEPLYKQMFHSKNGIIKRPESQQQIIRQLW